MNYQVVSHTYNDPKTTVIVAGNAKIRTPYGRIKVTVAGKGVARRSPTDKPEMIVGKEFAMDRAKKEMLRKKRILQGIKCVDLDAYTNQVINSAYNINSINPIPRHGFWKWLFGR